MTVALVMFEADVLQLVSRFSLLLFLKVSSNVQYYITLCYLMLLLAPMMMTI